MTKPPDEWHNATMPRKPSKKKAATRVAADEPEQSTEVVEEESSESISDFDDGLPPVNPHLSAIQSVASSFSMWKPSRVVCKVIRAIPTRFPQFDRLTRVGGWPLERYILIHGPSSHGKSVFASGIGESFLVENHFYGYCDAERTTTITWLEQLMHDLADHPGFFAMRPPSFEYAVDGTREFYTKIAKARDAGNLPPGTSSLVLVDSLRKLVPKNLFDKVVKGTATGGVDGAGGRGGQIRAGYNAAWLDEITPLIDDLGMSFAAITRESEQSNPLDPEDYKRTGGKGIYFESGLVIRIVRSGFIYETPADKKNSRVFGERHRIEIHKTKIAGKEERTPIAYFHTSNGVFTPPGFDRARDVLEMAVGYGDVSQSGSWYQWGTKKWQGEHKVVKFFSENPDALKELETDVRQHFAPDEELPEVTEDILLAESEVEQD
jgi:RecA/RadA recombinase